MLSASKSIVTTHESMVAPPLNTENIKVESSSDAAAFVSIDDTSDMAMGSIFDDADKHKQGAVLHWKRDVIRHIYPAALLVFDVLLIAAIFIIGNYLRYDEDILTTVSRRVLLVIEMGSVLGVALVGGYSYRTNTKNFRFLSEHIIVSTVIFVIVFFKPWPFFKEGCTPGLLGLKITEN